MSAAVKVPIRTEFIRLQDLLKLSGAAPTGGAAKTAVQSGKVIVNGEVCLRRGQKLRPGDMAAWRGQVYEVVRADGPGAAPDTTE